MTSSVHEAQRLSPQPIAEFGGLLGRSHDVGEEDRGQDTVEHRRRADAGHELLYLVEDLVGAASKGERVVPGQLDELGATDAASDVATVLGADVASTLSADHKRWRLNGGEYLGEVALAPWPKTVRPTVSYAI